MKNTLTLLTFLLFVFCGYSQDITDDSFKSNYNNLLEELTNENWTKSDEICTKLLSFTEEKDSLETENMVLRYMKIYCVAGLLNEKKITKDEAFKKTEFLKNKEMIMPAHPFNPNGYVNSTHFYSEEKDTFFSGVNNQAGTQIFSFEYVKIKNGIKETEKELTGKSIALKGKLSEISVAGNMFPRFNLKFTEGEYQIVENE